jgi:hypothetical protein
VKKKRWDTKAKRGIRAPARDSVDDEGHNEENHLQQDGSDDEMDTEAYVPHGWGAFSGSRSRAKKRAADAEGGRRKGASKRSKKGGGAGQKKASCCGLCRQAGHSQTNCPDRANKKPDTPAPTLTVEKSAVVMAFDVESDSNNKHKCIFEVGACLAQRNNRSWKAKDSEFQVVLGGSVTGHAREICPGLVAACAQSNVTFAQMWVQLLAYVKKHSVKYLKAHNGLASDVRILYTHGLREGVDVVSDLADAGVVGIIDPAIIIPLYKVTELQHPPKNEGGNHTSYLKNGVLFKMATGKEMAEDEDLTPHRALDDAKAEREWMMNLKPFDDLLFGDGAQQRACVLSMANVHAYCSQYEKNRAYVTGKGI